MKPSIVAKLEALHERHEEVQALLGDAGIIADQDRFRALSREYQDRFRALSRVARICAIKRRFSLFYGLATGSGRYRDGSDDARRS
ncbi:Peptide chain release factor 1 [Salmonella enterica subsp. enterica serovar Baildon str. R6-199]|nr:Peptide chain release factor 1 [Salmonella enterica subsp. enterica serovar Baildon str. R6-199]